MIAFHKLPFILEERSLIMEEEETSFLKYMHRFSNTCVEVGTCMIVSKKKQSLEICVLYD